MSHNSVIKKAQAGNFVLANDFSPSGARGYVLTRVANTTAGQPDDIDWRPGGGLPTTFEVVYVSQNGSDTTGTGQEGAPYRTINHALATIIDATAAKPYVVWVLPGVYAEVVHLKDRIHVVGIDNHAVFVDGIDLGATYAGGANASASNIEFTNVTLDFDTALSLVGGVILERCTVVLNTTLTGRLAGGANNQVQLYDCELQGDYIQTGCQVKFFGTNQNVQGGATQLTIQGDANTGATLEAWGGATDAIITVDQAGQAAARQTQLTSHGFSMSRTTVTKAGTALADAIVLANYGDLPENITIPAGAGAPNNQFRFSHQFATAIPALSAIGAGITPFTVNLGTLGFGVTTDGWHISQTLCDTGNQLVACSVGYAWDSATGLLSIQVNNPGAPFATIGAIPLNVCGYLPTLL